MNTFMLPELAYFLKVNIAIALFYAFYRLFCHKDTFFHWRRFILLGFLLISFLYPLLDFQHWIKNNEPINELANLYAVAIMPEQVIEQSELVTNVDPSTILLNVLYAIYLLGITILIIRFISQLISICFMAYKSRKTIVENNAGKITVRLLDKEIGPFSFFNWIFIQPQLLEEKELDEILTHEQTHVRQYHSLDVVLSELLCIICWINPFCWLLKREIRYNLEYLADNKVLLSGHDTKTYQYHLLGLTNQKAAAKIYNSFNVLPIKNRIIMMNKKRTNSIGRTKYVLFIPLVAILLLISNIEVVARMSTDFIADISQDALKTYSGIVKDGDTPLAGVNIVIYNSNKGTTSDENGRFSIEAKPSDILFFSYVGKETVKFSLAGVKDAISVQMNTEVTEYNANSGSNEIKENQLKAEDEVFMVVERMPEFPGGIKAMMQYLTQNIKYPAKAVEQNIQGRVIVSFVVKKDGTIGDAQVVRSISPDIDAEALRVVNLMPKWTPGTQRSVPVDVKYTLPIEFSLPKKAVGASNEDSTIYEEVDEMPEFPGGINEFMNFLGRNIRYPYEAAKAGTQGRVIAQFVIDTDGSVMDSVKILRSVSPELDEEAIRVIKTMPKWKPGKRKDVPVKVSFTVPVAFALSAPPPPPFPENTENK